MAGIVRNLRRSTVAAVFVLPSAFLTFAPSARAQSQSINGSIRGIITDSTGAPIAGAAVKVKNIDTGFTRDVITDGAGLYLAPALTLGTYTVTATATGFGPLTQSGIHLTAGSDATVDERLVPGAVGTEIEVTGDAPIIEPARFDLGRTISAEETQNLPLTSRNPYNFILFQPGISGHPNPENGIPGILNTNGLVDRVNYQLDGMVDTETDRYGLRLFAISDSYVKEIDTISNSFSPEFGNTAGVIFNTITNSGTNKYHGQAQYLWRPKAASSCPILNNCDPTAIGGVVKPSLHVDDFLGNVGGPVLRDKVFFFVAYEHLKRANPTANTITAANKTALINAGVSAADFLTAATVQRAQWVDGRIDWSINRKNQFFVRYNYFRNNYPFNSNIGGLYAISAASDFQDRAHDIAAQLVTTVSPTVLNEFRGSWPYRNEHHVADPLTGSGPMVTINGIANFGGSNAVGDKYQEKIPSFNDNVTWILGRHSMKFGTGFQKNNDTQLADVYTQYTFASIAQYINAKNGTTPAGTAAYSSVTASIGQPGAGYQSVFFNLFAQDTWQVHKNLLVTYGLRYDQYRAPTPPAGEPFIYTQSFRTPKGNFAPRLGISYSPTPTTVIRMNSGIFYEATPTNTWFNPLYNNGAAGTGSYIATISCAASATPCSPAFPNTFTGVAASSLPPQSIYAVTPKFKNEYTWNANLQVSQQLAKNDALTIGYILTNGRNMQFLRNMNLIPSGTLLADGRPLYTSAINASTRLYPQYNGITLIDVGSNTSFNALTATYEHRMSAGLSTSASYTWSHSISNTPEGTSYQLSSTIEDASNPLRDRSNSGINRPNAFTASAVYQPATHFSNRFLNGAVHGNELALLANFSSGDQQNITTSTKFNNDALATVRPLFVGRNSVRTPSVYQVDARFTRTLGTYFERVQPKIIVEGNNVFNHSNFTSINTAATVQTTSGGAVPVGTMTVAPTLLPTASSLEARILQFGLKIDF